MNYLATVTSKRQLTIPVDIFRLMKLSEGSKVLVSVEDKAIKIEPALALVKSLAGSVSVPKKHKGKDIDEIITMAKQRRFGKR